MDFAGTDDLPATAYSPARPVALYAEQIDKEKVRYPMALMPSSPTTSQTSPPALQH